MERLTNEVLENAIDTYKTIIKYMNGEALDEVTLQLLEELKEYRDAEEEGLLIRLPCKVGDELYCVYSPPSPANPADKGKWYMGGFEVARLHYGVKGLSIEMYGYGIVKVSEIGKTVFLTKEEAEQALKKMGGGVNDRTESN